MKKLIFFILLGSILIGCKDTAVDIPEKSKIIALLRSDPSANLSVAPRLKSSDDPGSLFSEVGSLVFTGDDIAWVDSKTLEIKFSRIIPELDKSDELKRLDRYGKIDVSMGDEHLFSLRGFFTGTSNEHAPYLFLCYMPQQDGSYKYFLGNIPLEGIDFTAEINKVKKNAGVVKFLNQLKVEKKLR